jgi:hypothetical protein
MRWRSSRALAVPSKATRRARRRLFSIISSGARTQGCHRSRCDLWVPRRQETRFRSVGIDQRPGCKNPREMIRGPNYGATRFLVADATRLRTRCNRVAVRRQHPLLRYRNRLDVKRANSATLTHALSHSSDEKSFSEFSGRVI